MLLDLKNNILYTLTFFDLLGKPLTLFECWQNLFQPENQKLKVGIADIEKALTLMPEIKERWGFYFLKGRRDLVRRRLNLHNLSQPKWKRAKHLSRLLALIPFVRLVAVCNTVAFNTADYQSDIDLLIIVKAGRLWLARFLVTFWVSLLGLRRHKDKIANRICLSFYLSDQYLDLKNIALKYKDKNRINDPYLVYWLAKVSPIYDEGIAPRFFSQNHWVEKFMPHYIQYQGAPRRQINLSFGGKIFKRGQEKILASKWGNGIENFFKKIQLYKMSWNTKSAAQENNTKVVISDDILKFHEKDLREYYRHTLDTKDQFC